MTNRTLRILTIITLSGAAVLFGVILSATVGSDSRNDSNKLVQDAPRKTLSDVAQERDIDTTYEPESDTEFGDLKSLTKHANTVVIGRITNIESSFGKSGNNIETYFTIEVARALKADSPLASPLRLYRPGGTVHVNGHTTSVRVKGNEHLKIDQDYIFFLEWIPRFQVYGLEGGLGAAFSINGNSKVKSLSNYDNSRIKLSYNGVGLEEFVNEVLSLR